MERNAHARTLGRGQMMSRPKWRLMDTITGKWSVFCWGHALNAPKARKAFSALLENVLPMINPELGCCCQGFAGLIILTLSQHQRHHEGFTALPPLSYREGLSCCMRLGDDESSLSPPVNPTLLFTNSFLKSVEDVSIFGDWRIERWADHCKCVRSGLIFPI